ncbi:hypothetical protein BC833DRAFT_651556 [Globomyces pollinis-pini]|nr:hypothetical protein BC833DRAFT_651556 [Globomyces pollinis-pini]
MARTTKNSNSPTKYVDIPPKPQVNRNTVEKMDMFNNIKSYVNFNKTVPEYRGQIRTVKDQKSDGQWIQQTFKPYLNQMKNYIPSCSIKTVDWKKVCQWVFICIPILILILFHKSLFSLLFPTTCSVSYSGYISKTVFGVDRIPKHHQMMCWMYLEFNRVWNEMGDFYQFWKYASDGDVWLTDL